MKLSVNDCYTIYTAIGKLDNCQFDDNTLTSLATNHYLLTEKVKFYDAAKNALIKKHSGGKAGITQGSIEAVEFTEAWTNYCDDEKNSCEVKLIKINKKDLYGKEDAKNKIPVTAFSALTKLFTETKEASKEA